MWTNSFGILLASLYTPLTRTARTLARTANKLLLSSVVHLLLAHDFLTSAWTLPIPPSPSLGLTLHPLHPLHWSHENTPVSAAQAHEEINCIFFQIDISRRQLMHKLSCKWNGRCPHVSGSDFGRCRVDLPLFVFSFRCGRQHQNL